MARTVLPLTTRYRRSSQPCIVQVAGTSHPGVVLPHWPSDAPASPHAVITESWPAGPTNNAHLLPEEPSTSHQSSEAPGTELSSSFPPRLPGLLTSHHRSGSEELAFPGAESSRASSRIPAHSALSRMLQDSSSHGEGCEETQAAPWSLGPAVSSQGTSDHRCCKLSRPRPQHCVWELNSFFGSVYIWSYILFCLAGDDDHVVSQRA